MIRSRPELIDDMARVAGGAVGILSGLGKQISIEARARAGIVADRLDLARADDVARLETLVKTLRLKQEEMIKRLDALERGAGGVMSPAKPSAKKPVKPSAKPKGAAKKSSRPSR